MVSAVGSLSLGGRSATVDREPRGLPTLLERFDRPTSSLSESLEDGEVLLRLAQKRGLKGGHELVLRLIARARLRATR